MLSDLRFANKGVYEKILLDNKGTVTPATDEIEKDLYAPPPALSRFLVSRADVTCSSFYSAA